MCWLAAREFGRDFCFERAATLSFATVISLMPLSVLLLGIAVQFGKGDEFIEYVKENVFPRLAPSFQQQLSVWLEQNISRKAFQNKAAGIVGILALASLVGAAMGGLNAAERIFNRLWKVKGRRSYIQKALTFWAILTLSPFLMATTLWVGDWLVPRGGIIDHWTQSSLLLQALYGFLVPLTLGFLGLTLLYRYLPQAHVNCKSAAFGAFIAATLWETSKGVFKVYFDWSSAATSLYGTLSIVPFFLVWVYLNWTIVLWGCEFAYAHQNSGRLSEEFVKSSIHARIVAEHHVAIYYLERIGRAFKAGESLPQASVVAAELSIPTSQVEEVARKLADAGVLVANAGGPGEFALARDPSLIRLENVVELFQSDVLGYAPGASGMTRVPAHQLASRSLLDEAHSRYIGAFLGKTLADLLALPQSAPQSLLHN